MKYINGSDLEKFTKDEARGTKIKRAFISDFYGGGVLKDGEIVMPVFDDINEIYMWENPQNMFSENLLESILDNIADATNLEKKEVVSKLENSTYFGNFAENLEMAIKSIEYHLGENISTTTKQKLLDGANHVGIEDCFMVRNKSAEKDVHDDILYLCYDEKTAIKVVEELQKSTEFNDAYILSMKKYKEQ